MSGDRDRFEDLASGCGPRVLGYLARRCDPVADAADIYQEVLVTTWRRLDSVPADDAAALGWMLGVARRCLANQRRTGLRRMAATQRLRSVVERSVQQPEPDLGLLDALDRMAGQDRELLTLIYWDGLSTEQVALALSISPATARKRLQRARSRLGDQLREDADPHPVDAIERHEISHSK